MTSTIPTRTVCNLGGLHGFEIDHVRTVRALPLAHDAAWMHIHRTLQEKEKEKGWKIGRGEEKGTRGKEGEGRDREGGREWKDAERKRKRKRDRRMEKMKEVGLRDWDDRWTSVSRMTEEGLFNTHDDAQEAGQRSR